MHMKTTLRIGIDYHLAETSHRGMSNYCRNITRELAAFSRFDIVLFTGTSNESICGESVRYRRIPYLNQLFYEQISLPLAAAREKIDLLWCPFNTFPLFLSRNIRLVATIHDLIFLDRQLRQTYLRQRIGSHYRRVVVKSGLSRIDSIVTVSKASRDAIRRELGVDAFITYNQIDIENRREDPSIVKRLNLSPAGYLYTISGTAHNKNLSRVIRAYQSSGVRLPLVVSGVKEAAFINSHAETEGLIFTDYVSEPEKNALMSNCKLFLFLSLSEGFGIPLLEAFAYGVPVLASKIPAVSEIAASAANLVDPENDSAISSSIADMAAVSGNPHLEDQRRVLRDYASWSRQAQVLAKVFQSEALQR